MPLIPIDSPTDPRVQPYADLRNRQLHVRDGLFVAEGDLVVGRLLESRYPIESLLVAEDQLTRLPLPDEVTTYCARDASWNRWPGSGSIAVFSPVPAAPAQGTWRAWSRHVTGRPWSSSVRRSKIRRTWEAS